MFDGNMLHFDMMKCLSLMQEYLCVPERCQQDEEQRESHPIHRQLSELQVQISWDAAGYIPTGPDISVSQGCIHVLYDVIFFLLFALHRVIGKILTPCIIDFMNGMDFVIGFMVLGISETKQYWVYSSMLKESD